MIVFRGSFTTLWITLQSNEELGLLATDYLEDYFGTDGQITLHHVEGPTDYPVLMIEQPAQTPGIPNDYFLGQIPFASIPDGNYEIRGRCKDVVDNYSILNSVQSPLGGEQTIIITFEIRPVGGVFLYYPMPDSAILVRGGFEGPTLIRPVLEPPQMLRPVLSSPLTARPEYAP